MKRKKELMSYFFLLLFWWIVMLVDTSDNDSIERNSLSSIFMALGIVTPVFLFLTCNHFFSLDIITKLFFSFMAYLLVGLLTHFVFEKRERNTSPIFVKLNVIK